MTGPWDVLREKGFPHVLDSVRQARHFVASVVEPRYDRRTADDAAIVVTELAANAFQHAETGFSVAVGCCPDGISISVTDHGPLRDGTRLPALQGHGLDLVDQIAGAWGTEARPDGKTVWARLAAG